MTTPQEAYQEIVQHFSNTDRLGQMTGEERSRCGEEMRVQLSTCVYRALDPSIQCAACLLTDQEHDTMLTRQGGDVLFGSVGF